MGNYFSFSQINKQKQEELSLEDSINILSPVDASDSDSVAVASESVAVPSESVAVASESVAVASESVAVPSESVAVASESVAAAAAAAAAADAAADAIVAYDAAHGLGLITKSKIKKGKLNKRKKH
jgi:hypothetical protein